MRAANVTSFQIQLQTISDEELLSGMTSWIAKANSALDRENTASFDVIGSNACKDQLVIYKVWFFH